ncbi:MAG: phosphodiesterase [Pirellulaceae bacterium]
MSLRIIQISDLHLFTDAAAELKGIVTRNCLAAVLRHIEVRHPLVHWLVVTGDLAHDEQRATYDVVRSMFGRWLPQLRVVPGNHDNRSAMRAVLPECLRAHGERNVFIERQSGWRIIGLDSHVPGELAGSLGPEQRNWLARVLAEAPDEPACLFVHHPPVPVNSPWLDGIGLSDAAELWAVLEAYPCVRLIGCGHVHQERSHVTRQCAVVTTPATGVQFRPETASLEVDAAGPGFRIIDLLPRGEVQTYVERVSS